MGRRETERLLDGSRQQRLPAKTRQMGRGGCRRGAAGMIGAVAAGAAARTVAAGTARGPVAVQPQRIAVGIGATSIAWDGGVGRCVRGVVLILGTQAGRGDAAGPRDA